MTARGSAREQPLMLQAAPEQRICRPSQPTSWQRQPAPERRFALRLGLRSVTNDGRDLPPDCHSRQAEEIPALADYRAAPAT